MMAIPRCQMQDKDKIHVGKPQPVRLSFRSRLSLSISRRIDPRIKNFIKKRLKLFTISRASRNFPEKDAAAKLAETSFKAGDWVRVRTIEEIRTTLNAENWLRGCKFMPEMEQYCGTTQRVFKPVNQFLNECDYTVRKAKGLVLLENVYCQGVAWAGPCDRSCFFFWRVEWLENLEPENPQEMI